MNLGPKLDRLVLSGSFSSRDLIDKTSLLMKWMRYFASRFLMLPVTIHPLKGPSQPACLTCTFHPLVCLCVTLADEIMMTKTNPGMDMGTRHAGWNRPIKVICRWLNFIARRQWRVIFPLLTIKQTFKQQLALSYFDARFEICWFRIWKIIHSYLIRFDLIWLDRSDLTETIFVKIEMLV